MRIGLFGGSFNPIHIGHIDIAKFAIDFLKLDKLIFIPAFKSLEKLDADYACAFHRCKMIEMVLPPKSEISTYEIDKKEPSPSWETVEHFSNIYKDSKIFFLIGEDNLKTLDDWGGLDIICSLSEITVWKRYDDPILFESKLGTKITRLNNPLSEQSSTKIKKDKKNSWMLHKDVMDYIIKENLYWKFWI